MLGYNITHTTAFDYDHVDLRGLNETTITKKVSLYSFLTCVLAMYTAIFCILFIGLGYNKLQIQQRDWFNLAQQN